MTTVIALSAGIFGLVVGSFLNVVIWRVPRGESVVRPRSHCPSCQTPIQPIDEIPVLSWLLLRGHCRRCQARISARYPLVELLTSALFVGMAFRFARTTPAAESARALPAFLYLAAIGVALALIDLDTKKLPNKLTLPSYFVAAALLGAAAVAGGGSASLLRTALGSGAMYALYFALWFAVPGGMGFGDVKLAGVLGAYLGWLGWDIWAVGLLAGWVFGGAVGTGLVVFGKAGRKSRVPFGPFMIAGALTAIFWGEPIAAVWLSQ